MKPKLTEKQKIFCREYLRDFNATQAAIRAGYAKENARVIASQNLSKLNIRRYVRSLADDLNERTSNDIERIIIELQLIAFGSLKDVAEWDRKSLYLKDSESIGDYARMVSEVAETTTEFGGSVKIKLYDKLKALELLGKYHKIFSDKEEKNDNKGEIVIKMSYDRSAPVEVE